VPAPELNRRRALQLGAAAAAAAALRPSGALGAAQPVSFELALDAAGGRARAAGGWRTLPPTRAPRRFDLIGLAWAGAGHVHAEVRAKRRGGRWTPWTPLHLSGDHAPDGGDAPRGTEPCWTGSADIFQVRHTGSPRRLRARFVRARPAAEVARRMHRRARSSRARQGASVPSIIPRSAWGGDSVKPRSDPDYGTVQVGFVHHSVTANDYGPEDSAAIVLGIARYHRDHNGWNDVGYNFLVDKYGQIFEGRAGGIDQPVMGAQAQGYNSSSTGVCCLGEYTGEGFPPAGLEAVARLLAWKLPLHGAPVTGTTVVISQGGAANRYRAGTAVTLERISGHRDGNSTSCPGTTLYGQLPALRERAAALAAPIAALTLTATDTTLRAPASLSLSGALRFPDGAPPAAKPIQVQYQMDSGAAWELVDHVQTAADGTWATTIAAPGSGQVRAVFPGDGVHGPLEAAPLRVKVSPHITVELSSRDGAPGRRVEVTGTVGPSWPTRINLKFERHTGRGLRRVQRKKVRVRNGTFSTYIRPPKRGRYRLTISAQGTRVRRKVLARL
jgi:hypothetical protein